jgi:hypothetical protein
MLDNLPEKLDEAACQHAENTGELAHWPGDLRIFLEAAYGLLRPAQRSRFFRLPAVRELLDDCPEYAEASQDVREAQVRQSVSRRKPSPAPNLSEVNR